MARLLNARGEVISKNLTRRECRIIKEREFRLGKPLQIVEDEQYQGTEIQFIYMDECKDWKA